MKAATIEPDWGQAACRAPGVDPDDFHPDERGAPNLERARRVCLLCPIRTDCGEYALSFETADVRHFGVWGGLSGRQRRQITRCRAGRCGHTSPDLCRTEVR